MKADDPPREALRWAADAVGPGASIQSVRLLAGPSFDYHPYWDLIVAIELLPGPPAVYAGWIAHGVRHLNDDIIRQRDDEYLASVMARL